jgi:predicted Zn-dependent peptidase
VVGDVNTKEVKKMVEKLFGSWAKGIAPQITYPDPTNVQQSQIDFVDMPNAVQSEISVVNTINLKLPTNNILLQFSKSDSWSGEGRLF